jgi:hypothetical protein
MVASVVHLVGEGGKEVAGTVDLAGEGGGREEVAEVEEVAGATDRPARRKKRRPSCHGRRSSTTVDRIATLGGRSSPNHRARSLPTTAPQIQLAVLLATAVRPRCAERREGEVELRRKKGQWRKRR